MCHRDLGPWEFPLTFRGTGTVESGGGGKLKRDEPPLFRGKSPSVVNLPLSQHVAKPAGGREAFRPEIGDVDFAFITLFTRKPHARHHSGR